MLYFSFLFAVDLELQNNTIGGPIPLSLGKVTTLETLTIEDNPFTGTIRTFC